MRKVLYFLLGISLIAFGLDWVHMIYHIADEPVLIQVEGVPAKLAVKSVLFLAVLAFLIFRKRWTRLLGFSLLLFLAQSSTAPAFARPTGCQHARELLDKSGTARDASENLFGQVKTQPPYGSFPSDMDKISWWGTFKPFEFWESPEFQAVWLNPQGQEVAQQKFRGNKCRLAKTTLRGEDQPRGEFQGGMWKVIVTCDDYLIDQQAFAVLPSGGAAPQAGDTPGRSNQQPAMIWAKDAVE